MQAIEVKRQGVRFAQRSTVSFHVALLVALAVAAAIVLMVTLAGLGPARGSSPVSADSRPYGQTQIPIHGNLAGDDADPGPAADAGPAHGFLP